MSELNGDSTEANLNLEAGMCDCELRCRCWSMAQVVLLPPPSCYCCYRRAVIIVVAPRQAGRLDRWIDG